jgi:hypothetical protein
MTGSRLMQRRNRIALGLRAAALLLTAACAGCVQIDAPDKPIVINLNINIKQEILYRLDGKSDELIEENADIF